MPLNTVALGQNFTATVDFLDTNGLPFQPKSPATYTIRDFNGNQVTGGFGAQDSLYPQRWTASITLPSNAPVDPNKKYSISWVLIGGNNNTSTSSYSEYFNVEPQYELPENKYSESVVSMGSNITDSLILDGSEVASNITLRVLDENDTVYYDAVAVDSTAPLNIDGNNVYFTTLTNNDLTISFRPYVIEWSFTVNGRARKEYHFFYIVSTKIIIMMEALRNLIDKVRFIHPNPNLRYNEADMLYYLTQGITIINGTKPQVSSYTLRNFPLELDWYLTNAAAYVALSAQYLAEGASSFEFGGQSVTLSVDRTASIDSALGRIIDVLDNKLPVVKANLIKASSAGVLHITYSPSLNNGIAFDRGILGLNGGFFGDYLYRANYYDDITSRLNPLYV